MIPALPSPKLIALFTDFGLAGPYHGQMQAVLTAAGVDLPVIPLLADAPRFAPRPSAYLLTAIAQHLPPGSLIISVVDPGVGSDRRAIIVKDSSQWFIGPDNGLLSMVARRSGRAAIEEIVWRPECLNDSFHGRDLFAPVAAAICKQEYDSGPVIQAGSLVGSDWPDDLWEVIYIDAFGNAVTGIRAQSMSQADLLSLGDTRVMNARTFSAVPGGAPFWYVNSMGLIEIAANQESVAQMLGLGVGSTVGLERHVG